MLIATAINWRPEYQPEAVAFGLTALVIIGLLVVIPTTLARIRRQTDDTTPQSDDTG